MTDRTPLVQIDGTLSEIPSGDHVEPAVLGAGTPSTSTVLYGDGVWRAPPSGGGSQVLLSSVVVTVNGVTFTNSTFQG